MYRDDRNNYQFRCHQYGRSFSYHQSTARWFDDGRVTPSAQYDGRRYNRHSNYGQNKKKIPPYRQFSSSPRDPTTQDGFKIPRRGSVDNWTARQEQKEGETKATPNNVPLDNKKVPDDKQNSKTGCERVSTPPKYNVSPRKKFQLLEDTTVIIETTKSYLKKTEPFHKQSKTLENDLQMSSDEETIILSDSDSQKLPRKKLPDTNELLKKNENTILVIETTKSHLTDINETEASYSLKLVEEHSKPLEDDLQESSDDEIIILPNLRRRRIIESDSESEEVPRKAVKKFPVINSDELLRKIEKVVNADKISHGASRKRHSLDCVEPSTQSIQNDLLNLLSKPKKKIQETAGSEERKLESRPSFPKKKTETNDGKTQHTRRRSLQESSKTCTKYVVGCGIWKSEEFKEKLSRPNQIEESSSENFHKKPKQTVEAKKSEGFSKPQQSSLKVSIKLQDQKPQDVEKTSNNRAVFLKSLQLAEKTPEEETRTSSLSKTKHRKPEAVMKPPQITLADYKKIVDPSEVLPAPVIPLPKSNPIKRRRSTQTEPSKEKLERLFGDIELELKEQPKLPEPKPLQLKYAISLLDKEPSCCCTTLEVDVYQKDQVESVVVVEEELFKAKMSEGPKSCLGVVQKKQKVAKPRSMPVLNQGEEITLYRSDETVDESDVQAVKATLCPKGRKKTEVKKSEVNDIVDIVEKMETKPVEIPKIAVPFFRKIIPKEQVAPQKPLVNTDNPQSLVLLTEVIPISLSQIQSTQTAPTSTSQSIQTVSYDHPKNVASQPGSIQTAPTSTRPVVTQEKSKETVTITFDYSKDLGSLIQTASTQTAPTRTPVIVQGKSSTTQPTVLQGLLAKPQIPQGSVSISKVTPPINVNSASKQVFPTQTMASTTPQVDLSRQITPPRGSNSKVNRDVYLSSNQVSPVRADDILSKALNSVFPPQPVVTNFTPQINVNLPSRQIPASQTLRSEINSYVNLSSRQITPVQQLQSMISNNSNYPPQVVNTKVSSSRRAPQAIVPRPPPAYLPQTTAATCKGINLPMSSNSRTTLPSNQAPPQYPPTLRPVDLCPPTTNNYIIQAANYIAPCIYCFNAVKEADSVYKEKLKTFSFFAPFIGQTIKLEEHHTAYRARCIAEGLMTKLKTFAIEQISVQDCMLIMNTVLKILKDKLAITMTNTKVYMCLHCLIKEYKSEYTTRFMIGLLETVDMVLIHYGIIKGIYPNQIQVVQEQILQYNALNLKQKKLFERLLDEERHQRNISKIVQTYQAWAASKAASKGAPTAPPTTSPRPPVDNFRIRLPLSVPYNQEVPSRDPTEALESEESEPEPLAQSSLKSDPDSTANEDEVTLKLGFIKDEVIDLTFLCDEVDEEELEKEMKILLPSEDEQAMGCPMLSPADSGISSPPLVAPNELLFKDRLCCCGKPAEYVCLCRFAMYCSETCQKCDWEKHKHACQRYCAINMSSKDKSSDC